MRNIKIERIDKKQKILLISTIIIIGIVVTLVLITSKAKYKNIQSIDLASGTINYMPADIDIVSINIENDAGEYESSNIIPSSGYVLSDDSYCNVNGEKDINIIITYENGKVGVRNITKKAKCYLYFDKYSVIDKIIGDTTGIQEKTSFTGIATSSDTGIYSAPDDYGTSYYFRGLENKLNNWVKFAGSYWRIIRVNGNDTIRMIYSGAASGLPSSSNKTGTTTQIGISMYNHTYNDNAYVGYMMGIPLNGTIQTENTTSSNSTSYEQAHTNTYDSDAKIQIDNWYRLNIEAQNLSKYIDINTGFCNDRGIASGHSYFPGGGYSTGNTLYNPANRLWTTNISTSRPTQLPTLQCSNKSRDLFTHTGANEGNKKLTYPVGLITSDEVVFAGGFAGVDNSTYYLYTNKVYWTMSPFYCWGTSADVYRVETNGQLLGGALVKVKNYLRPVINIKSDTKFTYNNETTKGSEIDPFIVV